MPRFAANLAYLFTERRSWSASPPRRPPASRRSSCSFPMTSPERGEGRAGKARPDHARPQHAPGNIEAGEFGLACVPGREAEFAALFRKALDYVVAIGGRQIHVPGGQAPTGAASGRRRRSSSAISRQRRRPGGGEEHHAADRADQCARPAGLLPQPGRARRRHHRQGRSGRTSASSSISTMCRSSAAISSRRFEAHQPVIGHVQVGGGAVAPRAGRGRGELSRDLRDARSSSAMSGWVGARIPAARPHRGRPRPGPGPMASIAEIAMESKALPRPGCHSASNGRGRSSPLR